MSVTWRIWSLYLHAYYVYLYYCDTNFIKNLASGSLPPPCVLTLGNSTMGLPSIHTRIRLKYSEQWIKFKTDREKLPWIYLRNHVSMLTFFHYTRSSTMKRNQWPSDQLSVKREKLTLCLFKSLPSCATAITKFVHEHSLT